MIINYLNERDAIHKKDRVNPILISNILKSYHDGEYTDCLQGIITYIDDTDSIDAHVLFTAFAVDLFESSGTIDNASNAIEQYSALLGKFGDTLSPTEDFQKPLKLGVDVFNRMFETKIEQSIDSVTDFPVEDLVASYMQFGDCIKQQFSQDVSNRKTAIKVIKQLKRLSTKVNILRAAEAPKDEVEEATTPSEKSPVKSTSKAQVDNYASVEWYKLVRNVGLLQNMLHSSRHFEAAVIYQDIQQELLTFDPKKYFPGLFFPLFKSLAPNAKKIFETMALHSNSVEWHIAKNLYATDPVKFLQDLPAMMENNYHDEQFSTVQMPEDENNVDESRVLLNEGDSYLENEHMQFNDSDEPDPIEGDSEVNEIDQLLEDIESVWDDSEETV